LLFAHRGGHLLAVVSPVPLVIQRLRGPLAAGVSWVATILLVGAVLRSAEAAILFALLSGPVLLIGEAMARGRGLRRGCLWAASVLCTELLLLLFVQGAEIGTLMTQGLPWRSPEWLAQMRQWIPPDQVDDWTNETQLYEQALAIVYPAVVLILGAVIVGANAVLVRTYLARRDPAWLDGGEFEGIRLPFGLAVVFLLAGASVFVPPLSHLGYNVLLLVGFLCWLQGVAVTLYFAHRLAAPPLLRGAFVAFVLLNPWWQLLPLLGLGDLWFDFRRWADVPEQPR
jgi:hypothetical protein